MCRRGNKHFDVHFRQSKLLLFPSKDGKDAACDEKIEWKGVYFPPQSATCAFAVIMIKVLFPICTLTWRVNNYVSCHGKGFRQKKKSTFNNIIIIITIIIIIIINFIIIIFIIINSINIITIIIIINIINNIIITV